MERLSLCMIARNEEALLPGCLQSVAGVVDEIILADTGSTDTTAEIARAAGAHVIPFTWNDDFAAARNAALAAATGDWILVMDADERLAPGAGAPLREALHRDDFDCGMLPLYNANRLDASPEEILDGRARDVEPILLPRLLRNTPDLSWMGRIHESIGHWVTRGARRVAQVNAPLLHLGSVPQVRTRRGKQDRNTRLIEARLAEDPTWIGGYEYLAAELLKQDDLTKAKKILDTGWIALHRVRSGPPPFPPATTLAHLRAQIQIRGNDVEGALETLGQARIWGCDHPNLDWVEARAHNVRAARQRNVDKTGLGRALQLLERCLHCRGALFAEEPIPGIFGLGSHMEAGHACLFLGRPEEALAHFDAILTQRPQDKAARLGRAEALLDKGAPGQVLAEVDPLLQEGIPDAWALAAAAAAALGALPDAAACAAQTIRLRDRSFYVPRRFFRVARWYKTPGA